MNWREYGSRLAGTFRRRREERLAEEMSLHLELEVEAGVRRGLTPEQALREARMRLGTVTTALERVRDQQGLPWLAGTLADLRQAAVALSRHRSFTALALGALAISVAASALVFTLVEGILLKPLPYPQPEQLIRVYDTAPRTPAFPVSIGAYEEYRQASRTLQGIALYTQRDLQLTHELRAERVAAVRVTADFFPTLGIQPELGRNFEEAEMRGDARVVILSHALWVNRFHGDRGIIGKPIRLSRENWTVIGVLPAGFQHVGGAYRSPLQGETVGIWWPLGLGEPLRARVSWHYTNAVARMKPGVTAAQAESELQSIAAVLARRHPNQRGIWSARVRPLATEVIGGSRITILLVGAATAVILLVASINIAGLCIARGLARRRETAIRQALGASTGRIVRAVLAENVVLALAGGALGLGLAAAAFPVLRLQLPAELPRLHEVMLTPWTAAFALLLALLTGVTAGWIPAWRFSRGNTADGLAAESRSSSANQSSIRMRSTLVISEIALACVLCVSAVLLAKSSVLLSARDHGFQTGGVVTFTLSLPSSAASTRGMPSSGYRTPAQVRQLFEAVVERWSRLPGVRAAGVATNLPWTGYDENTSFDIVGRPQDHKDSPGARYQLASPGYFTALRIPAVAGRAIEARDHADAPQVLVINESLARRYFTAENPLGRVLDVWGVKREIVGVMNDIRDRPADGEARPAFYVPFAQQPSAQMKVVVATDGESLSVVPGIERALKEVDAELPLAEVRTMDGIVESALSEQHLALWVFASFALLAGALAGVGIYALLAYLAQQRRKEVAIRTALGASRGDILWLVMRDGARLAGCGLLLGLLLAPVAGRALSSLLYGVTGWDAVALTGGPLLLLAAVAAASVLPAWGAARVQASLALRDE